MRLELPCKGIVFIEDLHILNPDSGGVTSGNSYGVFSFIKPYSINRKLLRS
jgi:hypothetical protein